ncbi:MAG: SH3 domain-containing protein [Anaerolineae bacterium]|nr:SH3 domain-containing protein [Anaerolineae bacterium]
MFVDTRAGLGAGVPVWSSAPGETPSLLWAGGDVISAQTAYTPWAQLAAPVFASGQGGGIAPAPGQPMFVSPGDVSTPQAAPALGVLATGGLATVNTTEGDQLNVRLGPGRDFDVVARLNDGERVTLIEGPRAADGFAWWKIRTSVGIEGWVVESVEDNGVRLQTLIPG